MDDHVPWPEPQNVESEDTVALSPAAVSASPDTSVAEVWSFYAIDWANSVYATICIGGFLPLLIQSSAQTAAGFPHACPNILNATATAAAEWPTGVSSRPTALFRIAGAGPRACDAADAPACYHGLCAGLPALVLDCRDAAGIYTHTLRTPSNPPWDPTSFTTFCITASVVVQAVVFLLGGALADRGGARKGVLLAASWLGAAACVTALFVTPATWQLGLPVAVVSNACFGLSGVMMNAYLPLLAGANPAVRGFPENSPERAAAAEARATDMSAKGFAAGYCAGVLGIILCVPLILSLPEIAGYQAAHVVAGVWWAAWMVPVARYLHARPGPPLPPGTCAVAAASITGLWETIAALRRLPTTGAFLLLWGVFSDAVFVVGLLGGLFANSRVDWGCTPKAQGVLALFAVTPLAAAVGNLGWLRLSQWAKISPERVLAYTLLAIGIVVPAVGLSGALTTGPALLGVAFWWGLNVGAMQAFSRSVFSQLVPLGHEAAFFSLFEITNRGSSWLGPLILTLSAEITGDFRWGFVHVLLGTILGAAGVLLLDIKKGQAAASAFRLTNLTT